ncbi:hypothetical protein ACFQ5B_04665 [Laceyella putida]|uniref:ATP-binding protein n=2 Tax=Laceyella putida TaxID=110101 RepID=A0ABW2RQL1_9BACL
MKTRYFPSNCFRIVPVQGAEKHERSERMQIINQLASMNKGFLEKGAGRKVVNPTTGEQEYRDVPHFSLKLCKRDGKIHAYTNLPKDKDHLLKTKFEQTLYQDIGEFRMEEDNLELPETNLYAFAVKGSHHLAIDLDGSPKIKELFRSVDHGMYSLTVKEVVDQEEKRDQLEKARLGLTTTKAKVWHYTKTGAKATAKMLYDFWYDGEDEVREKHQVALQQIKKLLPKKDQKQPYTDRKFASDNNKYMLVEALFLLWTDDEGKAKQFQADLQKLMTELQGENRLEVVKVKPDLSKVAKGRIHYNLPTMCLYQAEISKFLLLPDVEDKDFYSEHLQKTRIPEVMLKPGLGALAFARELYTNRVVYMPRPKNVTEIDSYVKATIAFGEQGSGKTSYIENQILETFLAGAQNETEWRRYGRSVVAFELADGKMIKNVRQHIPSWARKNVVILNHADTENPLPVNFHDVIKINKKSRSIKKQIADTETKILLDSVGDDSKTVAVERYFKAALQASYEVGKGNLIDALKILKDQQYWFQTLQKLEKKKKRNLAKALEENATDMINDPSVLKTIKNRLVPFMTDEDFINLIAQDENPDIDFWKWTNTGPYLVLIYLPGSGQEISQELRKFLFTHYFMKIWMMMLARERLEDNKRKECLIIVDELHQILDQRAVQNLFGALFKEPRKYRFRYVFTVHGWSSFDEAGKNAEKLKRSIKDARPNLVLLKGGDDFFKSMADMLAPYDVKDFTELMNMEYCGIFRIDVAKKTHIFMAKLIEPVDMRLPMYRQVSLEESRSMANPLGRPRKDVETKIYGIEEKEDEKTCQPQNERNLEEELAEITGGSDFLKAN